MPIKIKLEPMMDLDPNLLLREIKEDLLHSGDNSTFWENFITSDISLEKSMTWEEL